jgi:hypothetical protein
MVEGGMKCVKILLFIFNLVFVVSIYLTLHLEQLVNENLGSHSPF